MTLRKQVTSPDDWFPTAENGKVEVSLHQDLPNGNNWRVAVWGEDDFGLEKDKLSKMEAKNLFSEIVDGITKDELIRRGFFPA